MSGLLLLEDGKIFRGQLFGTRHEIIGEIVFNTAMTGYQEIITDPSYTGQIVTMTFPMIGIYGTNDQDVESAAPKAAGMLVREVAKIHSNFASSQSIQDYFLQHNLTGLEGIDTRALTRHIREKGALKGILSPSEDISRLKIKLDEAPGMEGRDLVQEVTPTTRYRFNEGSNHELTIAVLDCGVKWNILRLLDQAGANVVCYPAMTSPQDILQDKPDGVLLSNGPGDPAALDYIYSQIREFEGKLPVFGICLGHQLLCLAYGATTYKMKFGHRGANHPVKNLKTEQVDITSQNHGFCVDPQSLDMQAMEVTHLNLNDQTVEGIRHKHLPIFSIQYHPEASPGPHDARYLFEEFIQRAREHHHHAQTN